MKTVLKAAITATELFIAISDFMKIAMLALALYQAYTIKNLIVDYTTGARDVVVGVSDAAVDKATSGIDAVKSQKEVMTDIIINLQKKLDD